jgi:hypothetical protein
MKKISGTNKNFSPTERQRRDSVQHLAHDWAMFVRAGKAIETPYKFPLNHFIQHAFLVECRKFADFFRNKRGFRGVDIIANDFVVTPPFEPELPVWDAWADHMNRQLMHLSYDRVGNTKSWDGNANKPLFAEFTSVWNEFLKSLDARHVDEFKHQLKMQGVT